MEKHTIEVELDKEFYDWWMFRWPDHIKNDQTIMLVAEAAWKEAREVKDK